MSLRHFPLQRKAEAVIAAYTALTKFRPASHGDMPRVLNRAESDACAKRINENFLKYGFGLWAVEVM